MTDTVHGAFAAATALFVVMSSAGTLGLAHIYSRGVAQLRTTTSIGERDVLVLSRPLRIAVGQVFPREALIQHLDRIGYYRLAAAEGGCYSTSGDSLTIWSRYPELPNLTVHWGDGVIQAMTSPAGLALDEALIEPSALGTFMPDAAGSWSRTSTAPVPSAALADTPLVDGIIASEDGAFLRHHGIDLVRMAAIPFTGGGASTITMQVSRLTVLQNRRRTIGRKAVEIGVAMAMERVYAKQAILTAYANSVDLGARRGRPVHGFGAAAREFFGIVDVRSLTPLQAATLVALLNQPSRYLDALHEGDDLLLRRQRDRVLRLMQKNFPRRYSEPWLRELEGQPVTLAKPAADERIERISRQFLDHAVRELPVRARGRVYLTIEAGLQDVAVEAVEQGLSRLDHRIAAAGPSPLQAALIAVDPRSGDILAMVGGRAHASSQFNRAVAARRQVGSIMKPFDYLAAFERAGSERRSDISSETIVLDAPTRFRFPGFAPWQPANFDNDYAGPVTWRRALAESRNVAAVKVASWAGFERVAALWHAASGQTASRVFPSIALGAVQATPAEVAAAYAIFATDGVARPLRAVKTIIEPGLSPASSDLEARRIAQAASVARVRDMMRTVMNDGTGRGARAAGFMRDAFGKTGTTDSLRDAWFAGFTPELLTVVWVGRDDSRPLGLTGAQAALPIWTEFMKRALPLESPERAHDAVPRAAAVP